MFGDVVLNIPFHSFEKRLVGLKEKRGISLDNELSFEDLTELVTAYKNVYIEHGKVFPTDPYEQLKQAISAVFNSWESDRAIKYRQAEGIVGELSSPLIHSLLPIPHLSVDLNHIMIPFLGLLGTAVNVQAMCFGNMGDTSGTGVCFTRNPNTGEKGIVLCIGIYLF